MSKDTILTLLGLITGLGLILMGILSHMFSWAVTELYLQVKKGAIELYWMGRFLFPSFVPKLTMKPVKVLHRLGTRPEQYHVLQRQHVRDAIAGRRIHEEFQWRAHA